MADDVLILIGRTASMLCFLAVLVIVLLRVRLPSDAAALARIRLAMILSLTGWVVTQGLFAVARLRTILLFGGTAVPADWMALVVTAIAMLVGLVYAWAFYPFRKGDG